MMEAWLIELAKGLGRVFINPLFYWSIILVMAAGYRRIKRERLHFGARVFDVFSEWKNTWIRSILIGVFISALNLGLGIVFSYETILLLSIVVIILSLSLRFSLLSASYTIGITYLLLLFLPFLLEQQTFINDDLFTYTNFTGLSILLGIFLVVEANMLSRVRRDETFPELALGRRGSWIGQHHLKKLSVIPFFILIPTGLIAPFASFWPYFSIGGESYSIVLVPFLIGFDHIVRATLPDKAARKISQSILLLAMIVLLLAISSIFMSWLSLAAIFVAILGHEYINYRHRVQDKEKSAYFYQQQNGLKVLGIIPSSPANRLDILVGETIAKVNGKKITTVDEFYEALQANGSFFKLDILDEANEVRFVQSAFYEGDHHALGLIFTSDPYRTK